MTSGAGAVQPNGAANSLPVAMPSAQGVVELREDVPLKGSASTNAPWCAGGPRLVIICFAALSAAITLALFTQIYYGDLEVVPHGSVASDAAACSAAGTATLKAGGRALDAAVAAAFCLAVVAPHRTSLDASGALLYWEYRTSRSTTPAPSTAEWGGVGVGAQATQDRPPRLVAALAALHADLGALPWSQLLQPAIELAKNGFEVSESLAQALAGAGAGAGAVVRAGAITTAPDLAIYLESLQMNTSAEVSAGFNGAGAEAVRRGTAQAAAVGTRRLYALGVGAGHAAHALAQSLDPPPADLDEASTRVLTALLQEAAGGEWPPDDGGVSTGLAVIDRRDTYLALVTGTSVPFGSGPVSAQGWRRDEPLHDLDLAPAIMVDQAVCGTRFVIGAGSSVALAQAGAALGAGGGVASVERARAVVRAGHLAAEAGRAPLGPAAQLGPAVPPPHAAVNVVQQTADALLSHADSRGGGLASRF